MQPFDSVAVRAVATELSALATGARIDRVFVPGPTEVLLHLRGGGRPPARLLVSVRGPWSRVHLVGAHRKWENPAVAPPFCMLLRKHLEGAKIVRVSQPGLERVIWIAVEGFDEIGDRVERVLVAELTGKHSNLVLVEGDAAEGGKVLGCLRPVGEGVSRERQVLPGLPYDPPPVPEGRLDPLESGEAQLRAVLAAAPPDRPVARALGAAFHSLGQGAIAHVLADAGLPADAAPPAAGEATDRLVGAWLAAMQALRDGRFVPRATPEGPGDYRLLPRWSGTASNPGPGSSTEGTAEPGQVSAFLDAYYGDREGGDRLAAARSVLSREVGDRLSKLSTRVAQLEATLSEAAREKADQHRRWAELLLTFADQVPPHAAQVELPDPYDGDGGRVVVALDPRWSASQNAAAYFKRYQKAKTARTLNVRFLEEARAELAYWQSVAHHVEAAEDLTSLREIGQEVRPQPRAGKRKEPELAQPVRFRSSDGWEIAVGRNNRQNDQLTGKAGPADWWFHTQVIPGSHVVVKGPQEGKGGALPVRTRDEAALLAAWYSKGRASSKVPVVFTRKKHVRKPSGAKPGYVIYDHEETVWVTPDEGLVARIQRLD